MLGNHLVKANSAAECKHCVLYTRSQRFSYVGRQVCSSEAEQINLSVDFEIETMVFSCHVSCAWYFDVMHQV